MCFYYIAIVGILKGQVPLMGFGANNAVNLRPNKNLVKINKNTS